MPIHDWNRIPSGLFHDFHQSWAVRIKDALNAGLLPKGVSALVEQRTGPKEPDVLAVERRGRIRPETNGGVATLRPPRTRIMRQSRNQITASRVNRVVVKHHLGRTVAVVEIVSPGNKDSRAALSDFVNKSIDFFRADIHLLVVDLFPPTDRDPFGIHKAIWDEITVEDFEFPEGKNLTLVSYKTGDERVAYIEPVAIGDKLPDMPLFLTEEFHVEVPLERTYQAAWDASPEDFRTAVETGVIPDPDAE